MKLSLIKLIAKARKVNKLLNAIVELLLYVETITVDPKLKSITKKIELLIENIFGVSIKKL